MTESDILELISKTEPFSTAPESTRGELVKHFRELAVEPGAIVIEAGKSSSRLSIVTAGDFSVIVKGEVVKTLSEGDVFGEIGAVSGIPATATVRAETAGTVLAISASDLHSVIYHSPKLAEALLRSLTQYL